MPECELFPAKPGARKHDHRNTILMMCKVVSPMRGLSP